jgi:hypothetical protein
MILSGENCSAIRRTKSSRTAGPSATSLTVFMITRAAPTDGKILWHSHIGQVSNAPETYMLDAHQYLLVAAGDTLFSFTLY